MKPGQTLDWTNTPEEDRVDLLLERIYAIARGLSECQSRPKATDVRRDGRRIMDMIDEIDGKE